MTFKDFYNTPDDPAKKRGPHHLKLSRGLNMNRKNPGIVAKMHQLDSSESPLVRKLKGLQAGREVIHNPREAQKIASKYGIDINIVKSGTPRTLGNKTGITMSFDNTTGKFLLIK